VTHQALETPRQYLAEIAGPEFALGAACWRAREWLRQGQLEVGGSADLLVLDADPRTDLSTLDRPMFIVLRGRVVLDPA